jgi:hypothetical protein
MRALPLINRERVMNRKIVFITFTASILGLLFIFDVLPAVGSFTGSVLLVIGGTVLALATLGSKQEPWGYSDQPVTSRRSQSDVRPERRTYKAAGLTPFALRLGLLYACRQAGAQIAALFLPRAQR